MANFPAVHELDLALSRHEAIVCSHVCFSNRPFGVKRFQAIHRYSVDVAHGLVLLFGIGCRPNLESLFPKSRGL